MAATGTASAPSLSRLLARTIRGMDHAPGDRVVAEFYLRDWLGSHAAGTNTEVGRILRSTTGSDPSLDARVFSAAALSHITETDDLHRSSVTHPGCVVVPVALLLGEETGADSAAILRAVAAGYEAMIRIGDALGPAHYRVFHNTATAGVFGAASAACTLLDLSEDAWVWAFGNAGTQAAGLWEFRSDGTMSKHLHPGHAATAGVRSALLAGRGFTGPERILEGERGLFRALCADPSPERVVAPSVGWRIGETSLKPFPCCRHTHPAIEAALELRERRVGGDRGVGDRGVGDGGVGDEGGGDRGGGAFAWQEEEIEVRTYPQALDVTDDPAPGSPWEAKFSLQFCVAAALVHGAPGLATFEERWDDPALRRLMARIRLVPEASFAAAYPDRWGAEVRLAAPEGISARCEAAGGDPERPLDDATLDRKVVGLLRWGGVDDEEAKRLISTSRDMPAGAPPFRLPRP